jgi:hypothetical protein
MQLIIILFYVHKLRNYIDPQDDLPDNSLYMLSVESTQDLGNTMTLDHTRVSKLA